MSYTVTKSAAVLVPPAASTTSGTLSLSLLDRGMIGYITFISVFSHGDQPTARIKDAFAKALVHYYPVAGRIASKNDELVVNCTGQGIWFVEAVANCTLADVNYLELPFMIPQEEMLPRPPAGVKIEDQIAMVQITEFTCGGFSVGFWFHHMIFDAQGVGQFLKAVGEMSRGLLKPTIKPVWSREAIPHPPKMLHIDVLNSPLPTFNLTTSVIDISLDRINLMKDLYSTNMRAQKCTTFDIITAMIFKSRAKAINLTNLNDEVSLVFVASTRRLLYELLPSMKGYYGNCGKLVKVSKTSEEINNASVVEVANIIKDAKEVKGFDGCYNIQWDYSTMIISDWRRVGFNEVDYGWGEPKNVFTYDDNFNNYGFILYLNPPTPKQGIKLMLRCVKEEHKTEFLHNLEKF